MRIVASQWLAVGILLLGLGACTPGEASHHGPDAAPSPKTLGSTAETANDRPEPTAMKTAPRVSPETSPLQDPDLQAHQDDGSASDALGTEDLQNLGDFGILNQLMQSMAPGSDCDFDNTLSTCQ